MLASARQSKLGKGLAKLIRRGCIFLVHLDLQSWKVGHFSSELHVQLRLCMYLSSYHRKTTLSTILLARVQLFGPFNGQSPAAVILLAV